MMHHDDDDGMSPPPPAFFHHNNDLHHWIWHTSSISTTPFPALNVGGFIFIFLLYFIIYVVPAYAVSS